MHIPKPGLIEQTQSFLSTQNAEVRVQGVFTRWSRCAFCIAKLWAEADDNAACEAPQFSVFQLTCPVWYAVMLAHRQLKKVELRGLSVALMRAVGPTLDRIRY